MSVLVHTFIAATALRALRDAAHTLAVVLGLSSGAVNVLHVDWKAALGLTLGSALWSVCKSISDIVAGTSATSPAAQAVAAAEAAKAA